ncbi:unnamed protein product [Laminaria digitata]
MIMPTDWELRIRGYNVFSMCGAKGSSTRGVALVLKKNISGYVVGKNSPWHVAVRCFGGPLNSPWLILNVYLSSKKEPGKEPIAVISREIRKLRGAFPDDSVMIMGDFNGQSDEVSRIMDRCSPGMKVHTPVTPLDVGTRKRGPRRIDHLVSFVTQGSRARDPHIRMKEDLSDHFPVIGRINTEAKRGSKSPPTPKEQQPRMDPKKIPVCTGRRAGKEGMRVRQAVINSNRWAPLLELESTDVEDMGEEAAQKRVDDACEMLITVSHLVAKDVGLGKETNNRRTKSGVQKKVVQALRARRRSQRNAIRTTPGTPENHKAWQENAAKKERARIVVRQFTRKEWRRTLDDATSNMQHDPRTFYKWLSGTAGWRSKNLAVGNTQPVKHPETGELLTDPIGINDAWLMHYGALAKDISGNSRNPGKWVRWREHPQRRHIECLDIDIDSPELMTALKHLKRHKAPGNDRIPADFLKLAISTKGMSRLFRVLLRVINLMWRGVCIPKAWRDSTVVSIPKKGDVTGAYP